MTARLHRWDEIALNKITEMVSQKVVAGEREMVAQIYLKRGALIPMHTHDSEQMTYILQGALRFLVDGEEIIVRDRQRPIAKIVPLSVDDETDDAALVAAGLMRKAQRPLPAAFWRTRRAAVTVGVAAAAVGDDRADR